MPEQTEFTPLSINGLADFHCHCDYSVDAKGTIDDYCTAALRKGLAELCFTTHYDANPRSHDDANFISVKGKKVPVGIEPLKSYVEDVQLAQDKFYPLGLSVLTGLEFGWYRGCEEEVTKLQDIFDFDYLLVGIHELDDICFCCVDDYEKCFGRFSLEKMAEAYFKEMIAAANTELFDTIAHLDYYKKYGEKFYGPTVHRVHEPYTRELFRALIDSNTAIEINTAARRRGFDSYYPQTAIVNLAKRTGVEVSHLGSDAHLPEQVGFDFDAASSLIPAAIGGCDD